MRRRSTRPTRRTCCATLAYVGTTRVEAANTTLPRTTRHVATRWPTAWAGTAKPDPKSKNQTEQLLAEPEVHALVVELQRLVRSAVQESIGRDAPDAAKLGEHIIDLSNTILRRPRDPLRETRCVFA